MPRIRWRRGGWFWPMPYLLDDNRLVTHWVGPYPTALDAIIEGYPTAFDAIVEGY